MNKVSNKNLIKSIDDLIGNSSILTCFKRS